MQDLRLVLIILGFIAIVALIAHGLWSNKKNEVKPIKDKPLNKVDQKVKDRQGFDLDGIGEKRVVSKSVEPTMNLASEESAPVVAEKIEPQFSSMNSAAMNSATTNSATTNSPEMHSQATNSAEINSTVTNNAAGVMTSSFSATDVVEPVTPAPVVDHVQNDLSYDVVRAEAASVAADNVEPATHNEASVDNSTLENQQQSSDNDDVVTTVAAEELPDEAVFVINIMAREGQSIAGAALLQELSAFGFKFGAMDIFHRHVDAAGKGAVIFSLANMVKPGVFDIDTMEQFTSPGVSLFMMFPCAGQASHNYSLMLSAAERIADGVDGMLMDATRNPLTEDAIAQEKTLISKLENRSLAN